MGREQYILLSVLGLLAGAFMGVLSIKLLSPRPPVGAGPDVHDSVAISTAAEIVEPPTLSISPPLDHGGPADGLAAESAAEMPPVPAAAVVEPPVMPADDRYAVAASSFAPADDEPPLPLDELTEQPAVTRPSPSRDPFARAAGFDAATQSAGEPRGELSGEEPQRLDADVVANAAPLRRSVAAESPAATAAAYLPAPVGQAPRHEVTRYVAAVGDSWWSLAERMYGDGRYYRALFAWNRAVNPRVSLVPGTPLELPPLSKLAVAWPALVPE